MPISITAGTVRRCGKEFLEAGKKRLAGHTTREATAPEVQSIKSENEALKQLVAELSLENRVFKKKVVRHRGLRPTTNPFHHMTQSEKMRGRPCGDYCPSRAVKHQCESNFARARD